MSDESTSMSSSELADQASDRKIMREISLAIAGMVVVALGIYFIANAIAG